MIRATTLDDISVIQQIAKVSWNDTYNNIIPDEYKRFFLKKLIPI